MPSVPSVMETRSVSNSSMNWSQLTNDNTVTYLLVQHAHLHARVAPVLLENRAERPALQLAPAADDGARSVTAHVAAHERRERVRL